MFGHSVVYLNDGTHAVSVFTHDDGVGLFHLVPSQPRSSLVCCCCSVKLFTFNERAPSPAGNSQPAPGPQGLPFSLVFL